MTKPGWCGATGIVDAGDPPDEEWDDPELNDGFCECGALHAGDDDDLCACCGLPVHPNDVAT